MNSLEKPEEVFPNIKIKKEDKNIILSSFVRVKSESGLIYLMFLEKKYINETSETQCILHFIKMCYTTIYITRINTSISTINLTCPRVLDECQYEEDQRILKLTYGLR